MGERGEKEAELRYEVKPRPEFLSEYEEEMRRREREEKQAGIDEGESTMVKSSCRSNLIDQGLVLFLAFANLNH